jgi:hypothetical protein
LGGEAGELPCLQGGAVIDNFFICTIKFTQDQKQEYFLFDR